MTLAPVDSYRILLVEDNRGDAILITEALRETGSFALDRVASLAEAVAILSTERFDAILLDLGLPDSQGFDTLTAVLAHTRAPVLVLTGLDDEELGLQAVRHGAQDYMVKGRAGEEVIRRSLRFAIERARLRAALASPLIETAPVGLAVFDRGLRYLYVNPALAQMNGIPAEAHLGRTVAEVAPELDPGVYAAYRRVVETGIPLRGLEVSGRRLPTGDEPGHWLVNADALADARGEVIGLTASFVDITGRKRQERALAQLAEVRLQAQVIGESIPYGIWIAEPDGGLRYASQSFLDLIGMTMEEAAGYGWTGALAPEAVERYQVDWAECRHTGGQWEYELTLRAMDERWYTVLSRGYPIRDDAGEIVSWAGINLDITERKEAEAFRDAFIGVLSHELRTPITSIYGASALLGRTGIDSAREAGLLEDISDEAERLRRLVEDLLVLAKAERGNLLVELEPILLQHVVPRVVAEEQRRWEGRRFELTIDGRVPVAAGDEALVQQVLRNLLSNAAKYGPSDGAVTVILDSEGGMARLRVLDQGPGIDIDEADRLFDLFYRSQRTSRVSGSGIGLFVVRRLVESMGGRVWARPRPEGGSEFGVALELFRED